MFMSSLCLRYGAYLNDTYNVLACLLTIFLGRDWFRLFLNKWDSLFRNFPTTTFWKYEHEYV